MNTSILIVQTGIPVARMELLDDVQMGACISYSKLEGYEEKPTIFFEFHGTKAGQKNKRKLFKGLLRSSEGPLSMDIKMEDRNKLWQARHDAYYRNRSPIRVPRLRQQIYAFLFHV